jgi:hypothetical protein
MEPPSSATVILPFSLTINSSLFSKGLLSKFSWGVDNLYFNLGKSCKVGPFTRMACSVAVDSLIVDQLKAERRYPETTLTAIVLSTINSTNLGHFKMSALGKISNINRIVV